ncbi:MAG: hypothetical protein ACOX6V_00860 [Patescibacteria group bacterium]|jgi:hypothetical protein
MDVKEKPLSFTVSTRKDVNTLHQTLNLVHELGHIIGYFKHKNSNRYNSEKEAIKTVFLFLKSISEELFHASFIEVLNSIHHTLFEIEVYKNPNQDFDKLYLSLFNKCFWAAKEKENLMYLINFPIVTKPLTSLFYSLSYVELLLEMEKVKK